MDIIYCYFNIWITIVLSFVLLYLVFKKKPYGILFNSLFYEFNTLWECFLSFRNRTGVHVINLPRSLNIVGFAPM